MKKQTLITLLLLAALSLSACQAIGIGGKPAATAAPTDAGSSNDTYPAPMSYPPAVTQSSASLYPNYETGMEIGWPQAVAMIINGEVSNIVLTKDLKVTLSLKDGRTLTTTVTSPDEVQQVIQTCGDPCKSIQVTTE